MRIGAKPEARTGSLGDNLCSAASHSGEQPIKPSLARHEFDFPKAVLTDKLIVPFGDAKDFIYRLDPFSGDPLFSERGCEHLTQGGPEPPGLQEEGISSLRIELRQIQKLCAALRGDNVP